MGVGGGLFLCQNCELTLNKKFDELFVIMACAEEEFCIDFTNNVHIRPLNRNVNAKIVILDRKII